MSKISMMPSTHWPSSLSRGERSRGTKGLKREKNKTLKNVRKRNEPITEREYEMGFG